MNRPTLSAAIVLILAALAVAWCAKSLADAADRARFTEPNPDLPWNFR